MDREAFEKVFPVPRDCEWDGIDAYCWPYTRAAHPYNNIWEAWQAAKADSAAQVEALHPSVIAFAKAMQYKLDKNKHKDGKGGVRNPDGSRNGWSGCSVLFLREKLEEEVEELIDALEHDGPDEVRNEAADVGNIAMMLADIRGELKEPKP